MESGNSIGSHWKDSAFEMRRAGWGFGICMIFFFLDKYLHDFNLAMLAKQGWSLIANPGSLVAGLLRACYYLNGSSP